MVIVGIEKTNYTNKKTGEKSDAIKFYLEGERKNVEGVAVESVFISARWDCYEKCLTFKLGDNVQVSYNRWGSVDSLWLTDSKK